MIAINYWLATIVMFLLAIKIISNYKSKPVRKYEVTVTIYLDEDVYLLDVSAKSERQAIRKVKELPFVKGIIDCKEVTNGEN